MPWFSLRLDGEGLVAAAAVFLGTIFLSWATSWFAPLSFLIFWLGMAGVVAALFAGRSTRRVTPDLSTGIIAPCDGIVVSIDKVEAPSELRMVSSSVTRVRISSAPTSSNKLYAPIAGGIDTMIVEPGDSAVLFALAPDDDGLHAVWLTVESQGQQVGMRVACGGFGPRLEMEVEAGDSVRLGRILGVRRLGGWCDLFVPSGVGTLIWPGQTLVGGETVIGRLKSDREPERADEDQIPATPEVDEEAWITVDQDEDLDDGYDNVEEASVPDDPAVLFARLKEATRKHGESD